MDRDIKDKIAIITGGAQGIGFSIADKFLDSGAKHVIILDILQDASNTAVKKLNDKYSGCRAVFIKCDVTRDLETVSNEILATYKTIDVLVNNAGWTKENSIRDTMELNVIALVEWSMKFFEHMRIDKGGIGGTIVNISSIFGFRAAHLCPFYATSKHAVLGFTKSKGHAKTFAKSGVRIVAICPGFVKTHLVQKELANTPDPEIKELAKNIMKIWQEPEAVGAAAVQVFQRAESGTAWLIEEGKPIGLSYNVA